MLARRAWSCSLFFFNLSFLWAFWWPPKAWEFANSLPQYWHSSLFITVNDVVFVDELTLSAVVISGERFPLMSSKPNSFIVLSEDEPDELSPVRDIVGDMDICVCVCLLMRLISLRRCVNDLLYIAKRERRRMFSLIICN